MIATYNIAAPCNGVCAGEPLPDVPEQRIAELWEEKAGHGLTCKALTGERINVLAPGSVNMFDGPDFSGAIVEIDGAVVSGAVEIHRRIEDWFLHGHQHNPRYNDVVLHAVLYPPDGPVPAGLPPTIVLAAGMTAQQRRLSTLGRRKQRSFHACIEAAPPTRDLQYAGLELAAETRFARKTTLMVERAESLASNGNPDGAWLQVLYERIARGLGYGGNADALQQFAEDVPLALLRTLSQGKNGNVRDVFDSLASGRTWQSKAVRPSNRIAGRLLHLRELLPAFLRPDALDRARAAVAYGGVNGATDVLDRWLDGSAALIGAERAYEIAVNVFAPWAAGYAGKNTNTHLAAMAVRLYFYSVSPPSNRHIRAWKQEFGLPDPMTSGMQQGIIELRTQKCSKKACAGCLLASARLSSTNK